MKKCVMSTTNYPPPPPPPPASSKRFSKTMIAALIAVLAVAVVVGAFYATNLQSNNDINPSPSVTPSSSPSVMPSASASDSFSPSTTSIASPSPSLTSSSASPTSTAPATATTSPSGPTTLGYRDGAWANYTTKNYNESGAVTALYNLRYAVSQGTLKGVDCWILQTDNQLLTDDSVMNTVTTYWLDKSSLHGIHYKIVISSNGIVISDTENDYSPGDVNNIPTAINPSMVLGTETITVPAGTFNCDKSTTTTTDRGYSYVTTVWGNSNIPVIGMVKQQMTVDGVLILTTELTAYGG